MQNSILKIIKKSIIHLLFLGVVLFFSVKTIAQCKYFTTIAHGIGLHTLAIKNDSTLWAWGANNNYQLGDGTNVAKYSQTEIGIGTSWISVSVGNMHSLAIASNGSLWAWGGNLYGGLGVGTTYTSVSPIPVDTATNWVSVSAGGGHSLGITADGKLWAWGSNSNGQLGDGTTFNKYSPIQIGTDTNWVSVCAGSSHSLGITSDGKLWAWGYNSDGQLGDSTIIDKHIPTQIGTATNWASIGAGFIHSLATTTDGKLWAWGDNYYNQLGDNTNIDKHIPTQIGTATNWAKVSAGSIHSMGITTNGKLWAWGMNNAGQLGNNTYTNLLIPTQIGTATNWVDISGEVSHTIGLTADNKLWAWGDNTDGALGDGTTIDKKNPEYIRSFTDISTFAISVCNTTLPYIWQNHNLTSSGMYIDTFLNANACDSLTILHFTVNVPTSSYNSLSLCKGELPYLWNGTHSLTTFGTYSDTLTSSGGCDSIATLYIFQKNIFPTFIFDTACSNNLPFVWHGHSFTASISFLDTLHGTPCDTPVYYSLYVAPAPTANIVKTNNALLCSGITGVTYQWALNGVNIAGANTNTLNISQIGNYSVYITDMVYGCVDTEKMQILTLATQDFAPFLGIKIYPNPIIDNNPLQLEIDNYKGNIEYTILDITGKINTSGMLIYNGTKIKNIATTGMAKGIYTLILNNGEQKTVQKLIIN